MDRVCMMDRTVSVTCVEKDYYGVDHHSDLASEEKKLFFNVYLILFLFFLLKSGNPTVTDPTIFISVKDPK